MAQQDVLSLSLDDIIRKSWRRGVNRRGRGWGMAGRQEPHYGNSNAQGRGRGRGRDRGRGPRFLATKFTAQQTNSWAVRRGTGAMQGRGRRGNTPTPWQGRQQRGIQTGRGRGLRGSRGGRGFSLGRGRGVQNGRGRGMESGRGRGSIRGRSSVTLLRRGRGSISYRGSGSQQHVPYQDDQQHTTARASSFRQKLARRKIEQARKTLVMSQQNNRAKTRLSTLNARRGIQQEVGKQQARGASSVVSLSSDHGLTVSIKNNIAGSSTNQRPGTGPTARSKPKLNRNRLKPMSSTASSVYTPAVFTVVNDRAVSPEPPEPPPPRRILKRNMLSRDPRSEPSSMRAFPQQNLRPPPPEPHRQVLDSKVQKEIAMLQGKDVSLNNGPGPGVKGFKHVPSQTSRSLNERFTEERMIT